MGGEIGIMCVALIVAQAAYNWSGLSASCNSIHELQCLSILLFRGKILKEYPKILTHNRYTSV